MKKLSLCHVLNETSVGGGAVHTAQLLKDHADLGHPAACVTYELGPIAFQLEDWGIPVHLLKDESELEPLIRKLNCNIAHGHTCGGGALVTRITRKLQQEGRQVIGGEHVHSVVPGDNPDADFEVVEIELMRQLRPRCTVIPWACSTERLEARQTPKEAKRRYGIPVDVPVIGRNGRLDGSKNPADFVRCLARIPHVWGLLSGWGVETGNLDMLARELGCRDRLVMPGLTLRPGDVYAAIDIVVYPTTDESWCAGVVEPLLLGKPVVCYPVGGMGENVVNGVTGLQAHSVDGLVAGVRHLLANPEYAAQLGQQGRELVRSKGVHDPVLEAQRHLDLYRACFREKGWKV